VLLFFVFLYMYYFYIKPEARRIYDDYLIGKDEQDLMHERENSQDHK
jgi:hypothetical protein